jgi:hypothetical protein
MTFIDRIIIGQVFRSPIYPGGNVFSWRIDSPVLWSQTGERFVWCLCQRAGKRKWRPRVFEIRDLPGPIGDDLRAYFKSNPHLPKDGHP